MAPLEGILKLHAQDTYSPVVSTFWTSTVHTKRLSIDVNVTHVDHDIGTFEYMHKTHYDMYSVAKHT